MIKQEQKKQHKRTLKRLCLLLLFILTSTFSFSLAEAENSNDKYNFVEVNENNKSKCVQYFRAKDKQGHEKLYCNTTAAPLAPKTISNKANEHLNLTFDQRHWVSAWEKKTPEITTVEYIVSGDNIKNWKELITSQFFPKLQQRLTPSQYADNFMGTLTKQFPNVQVQYLVKTEQEVVFEFKLSQPKAMAQHEIQRVFRGKKGMHILHYAIKKPEMGAKAQKEWLHRLQEATPKQASSKTK